METRADRHLAFHAHHDRQDTAKNCEAAAGQVQWPGRFRRRIALASPTPARSGAHPNTGQPDRVARSTGWHPVSHRLVPKGYLSAMRARMASAALKTDT